MSKKKVTVPKTIKPGKGKPPEHLAYLNWHEMEALRRLNGEGPYNGPNGIPSFVLGGFGSLGANTYTSSGKTTTSKPSSSTTKNTTTISKTSPSVTKTTPTSTQMGGGNNNKAPQQKSVNAAAAAASSMLAAKKATSPASSEKALSSAVKSITKPSSPAQTSSGMRSESTIQAIADAMNQPVKVDNAKRLAAITRGPGQYEGLQPNASPLAWSRAAESFAVNDSEARGITGKDLVDRVNAIKGLAEVGYNPEGVKKLSDRLGYTPVGIRANNPGNLLTSEWQKDMPGYAGPYKSPNGLTYSSYNDPRWGLAAQQELLGRYHDMGKDTINSVVDRYAPVDENNSAAANRAYKDFLSKSTGFEKNEPLTRAQVQSLGPYKTAFENSGKAFAGGPFGGAAVGFAALSPAKNSLPSTSTAPKVSKATVAAGLGGISSLTPDLQFREVEDMFRDPIATKSISPAAREPVGYSSTTGKKVSEAVSPSAREPVGYGDARAPTDFLKYGISDDLGRLAAQKFAGMVTAPFVPSSPRKVDIADKEPQGYATSDEIAKALSGEPDIKAREPVGYTPNRLNDLLRQVPAIPEPNSDWTRDFDERFNKMRGVDAISGTNLGADSRLGVYEAPLNVPAAKNPMGADARQLFRYNAGKAFTDRVPQVEGPGRVSLPEEGLGADARQQGTYTAPPTSMPKGNVPKEAIPGGLADLFGSTWSDPLNISEDPSVTSFGPRMRPKGASFNQSLEPTGEGVMGVYNLNQDKAPSLQDIVAPNPVTPDERTVAKGYGPTPDKVIPGLWNDIQRNTLGINAMKALAPMGGGLIAEAISRLKSGKSLTNAMRDELLTYQSATPEERAAMEAESADLIRYGQRSPAGPGTPPELAQQHLEDWNKRQRDAMLNQGGGDDKNKPKEEKEDEDTTVDASNSKYRPYLYYLWDLGVNIPSPGDSNYNLYQKYLAKQ